MVTGVNIKKPCRRVSILKKAIIMSDIKFFPFCTKSYSFTLQYKKEAKENKNKYMEKNLKDTKPCKLGSCFKTNIYELRFLYIVITRGPQDSVLLI
jgi:hypothetical protein